MAQSKPEKVSQMFSLVQDYENGPKKMQRFCDEHDLNKATFKYWQKKYRLSKSTKTVENSEQKFIPIEVLSDREQLQKQNSTVELLYPNGVCLRLGSNNISILKELIKALD